MELTSVAYGLMLLVLYTKISLVVSEESNLVYACYPNGTLKIQNPGGYQGVFANNSNTICNVTFINDKLFLLVKECPFDIPISVTFSNYTRIQTGVLGGRKAVEAFLITCNQIPASGTFRQLSNDLGVAYTSTNLSSVYPDYPITSNITRFGSGLGLYFPAYSANINDPLFWFIYVMPLYFPEDDVILRPELCTAYAGLNVTNSTSSKNITLLGCTLDDKLTGNFHYNYSHVSLVADLFAFRFMESEYITIECDVRICPNTSTFCDIVARFVLKIKFQNDYQHKSCDEDRRRREDLSIDTLLDDSTRLMKAVTSMRVDISSSPRGYCSYLAVVVLLALAHFC